MPELIFRGVGMAEIPPLGRFFSPDMGMDVRPLVSSVKVLLRKVGVVMSLMLVSPSSSMFVMLILWLCAVVPV